MLLYLCKKSDFSGITLNAHNVRNIPYTAYTGINNIELSFRIPNCQEAGNIAAGSNQDLAYG